MLDFGPYPGFAAVLPSFIFRQLPIPAAFFLLCKIPGSGRVIAQGSAPVAVSKTSDSGETDAPSTCGATGSMGSESSTADAIILPAQVVGTTVTLTPLI